MICLGLGGQSFHSDLTPIIHLNVSVKVGIQRRVDYNDYKGHFRKSSTNNFRPNITQPSPARDATHSVQRALNIYRLLIKRTQNGLVQK